MYLMCLFSKRQTLKLAWFVALIGAEKNVICNFNHWLWNNCSYNIKTKISFIYLVFSKLSILLFKLVFPSLNFLLIHDLHGNELWKLVFMTYWFLVWRWWQCWCLTTTNICVGSLWIIWFLVRKRLTAVVFGNWLS